MAQRAQRATIDGMAAQLGASVRSLRRLQSAGAIAPVVKAAGRRPAEYDVLAVARALLTQPQDATRARAARDEAQAELLRLRIARERAGVFPKDAIVRAGRSVVEAARTRLSRLPADLRRAEVVTLSGERMAEGIVRETLEELARLEVIV